MKPTLTTIIVALTGLVACVSNGAIVLGDVAIVRVNADTDGFSVLALRDLDSSETLFASDNGWLAAGGSAWEKVKATQIF